MTGLATMARRLGVAAVATAAVVAPEFLPVPKTRRGRYGHPDELVADLRRGALQGWDLVAEAQRRVHEQFTTFSCRQPWRSPAVAFAQRRGYCLQYNQVLYAVLRDLGFDVERVFAARVRTDDAPWWRMGHVWVRVRYDGRTKSCCARHATAPGEVAFVPVSDVVPFRERTQRNLTAAMTVLVGPVLWKALLLRRPVPGWIESHF